MVKKIILLLLIISLALMTACTTSQDVGVTAKYYDSEGNLIGSQDLTTSMTEQAIVVRLNNMPSITASVSYVITTTNNGEVPITISFTKADFTGEYE